MPFVQEGLLASATGRVQLGAYQEVRIRHFHQTLDRYLAEPCTCRVTRASSPRIRASGRVSLFPVSSAIVRNGTGGSA